MTERDRAINMILAVLEARQAYKDAADFKTSQDALNVMLKITEQAISDNELENILEVLIGQKGVA